MPVNHNKKIIFIHIPKTGGESIERSLNIYGGGPHYLHKPRKNKLKGYELCVKRRQKSIFWGKHDKRPPYYKGDWDITNLQGIPLQHCFAPEVKKKLKNHQDFFSFSFVRNPFSRCVSEFLWHKHVFTAWGKLKEENKPNTAIRFERLRLSTFPHWVKTLDFQIRHNQRLPLELRRHNLPQHNFIMNKEGEPLVDFIGKFENFHEDFNIICDKMGIQRRKLPHANKAKPYPHYTEFYDDESRNIVSKIYAKDIEIFGYKFNDPPIDNGNLAET